MDNTNQTDRELTYGEKAVGITFNPGGDELVNQIKTLYAKIIDTVIESPIVGNTNADERNALVTEAVRQAQTAQMWAIKAITYKY